MRAISTVIAHAERWPSCALGWWWPSSRCGPPAHSRDPSSSIKGKSRDVLVPAIREVSPGPRIASAGLPVCPDRGGGLIECGAGFVQQCREPLENVRHLRPDPQVDPHVVRGGVSRQP